MLRFRPGITTTLLIVAMVICADQVIAGDKVPGWYLEAELASVMTAGNSESSTFGFGGKVRRLWTRSELTVTGGATQAESSLLTRTARGTADAFQVYEDKVTTKTTELFFMRGYYKYNFSPKFFTFSGVDWMTNKFAGIDSRFLIAAGAGNSWKSTDTLKFDTFYSLTYSFQEDVVENPFVKSDFPGLRFGYVLDMRLSSTTTFESNLVGDLNLDNSDDIRFDWYNSLPITISETLQLKPALRLLWRNQPALTNIPLVDAGGTPTGDIVAAPLQKTDTIFTLALVVKLGPKG